MKKTVFDEISIEYRQTKMELPSSPLIKDALFSPFESIRGFGQHLLNAFIVYPIWHTLIFSKICIDIFISGLNVLYNLHDKSETSTSFEDFKSSLISFFPALLAIPVVPLALILAIPVRGVRTVYESGKNLFFAKETSEHQKQRHDCLGGEMLSTTQGYDDGGNLFAYQRSDY